MNRLGIHTGADLKAQSLEFLEQYFGTRRRPTTTPSPAATTTAGSCPTGRASRSARRPPSWRISAGRPRSSEGVASVLDDVWSYCERTGVAGRTVTVKIKYADFQIVTRSRTLGRAGLEPRGAGADQRRAGAHDLSPGGSGCACSACRCTTCKVPDETLAEPQMTLELLGDSDPDVRHHALPASPRQDRRLTRPAHVVALHVLGLAGAGDETCRSRQGWPARTSAGSAPSSCSRSRPPSPGSLRPSRLAQQPAAAERLVDDHGGAAFGGERQQAAARRARSSSA